MSLHNSNYNTSGNMPANAHVERFRLHGLIKDLFICDFF